MQIKNYLRQRKKLFALVTVIIICLFVAFATKPWNQRNASTSEKANKTMDSTRSKGYYVYEENSEQPSARSKGYYVFEENSSNPLIESEPVQQTVDIDMPTNVPDEDLTQATPNDDFTDNTQDDELSTSNRVDNTSDNTPVTKGMVSLEFSNGNREAQANSINPRFRITNNDAKAINLTDVKIRYYYINEEDEKQNFWCDWSSAGTSNVTGDFFKLPVAKDGTDTYLEIGFTGGNLEPNESVEIQARFSKDDWSNYTQSNHYSFNSSGSDYVEWDKVTLYVSGELVYGKEP